MRWQPLRNHLHSCAHRLAVCCEEQPVEDVADDVERVTDARDDVRELGFGACTLEVTRLLQVAGLDREDQRRDTEEKVAAGEDHQDGEDEGQRGRGVSPEGWRSAKPPLRNAEP